MSFSHPVFLCLIDLYRLTSRQYNKSNIRAPPRTAICHPLEVRGVLVSQHAFCQCSQTQWGGSMQSSAQARTITAPEGHIKGGSLLAHPANQTLLYNMVGRNRKCLWGFAVVCVHRRWTRCQGLLKEKGMAGLKN